MDIYFPIAGVEVNPLALLLIGFTVGVCGAFFGIGGAFMVALSVILKQLSVNLGQETLGTFASYLILTSALVMSGAIMLSGLNGLRRTRQQRLHILPQLQDPP